jgi:5-formyltetrahydrofolate cyclo-ligase
MNKLYIIKIAVAASAQGYYDRTFAAMNSSHPLTNYFHPLKYSEKIAQ